MASVPSYETSLESTTMTDVVEHPGHPGRSGHPGAPDPGTRQRAVPYTRRATDDSDEAESIISDLYLPNRLELPAGPDALGMDVTGLQLGGSRRAG